MIFSLGKFIFNSIDGKHMVEIFSLVDDFNENNWLISILNNDIPDKLERVSYVKRKEAQK